MFSCVETGDFYEKEKLELEDSLSQESQKFDDLEEGQDQIESLTASDQVVVYADVDVDIDVEASAIVVVNNSNTSNNTDFSGDDENLDSLLDQSITEISNNNGETNQNNNQNNNIGDEQLPNDLKGTTEGVNESQNTSQDSTQANNTPQATEQGDDSTTSSETTNNVGGDNTNDSGQQSNETPVIEIVDDRPSREQPREPIVEEENNGDDQTTDDGSNSGDQTTDNESNSGDQTTDNGTNTDDQTTDNGTNTGDQTTDNGSNTGDQTTDNGTNKGDQTTDNGTNTGDQSTDNGSNTGDQTTDNGTNTGDQATDIGTNTGDQTTDNGSNTGDQTTDNGSNTGDQTTDNGNQNNDQASEEGEEGESDDNVVVVPDENQDFVNEVEDGVAGDKFICDPFDGEQQTSFQGVAGFVYDGLEHPFTNVQDYYDFGKKSETPIFMSEINVPTTKFDKGFELENGQFVLNDMGGKLFEYFALDLRGRIRLGEVEENGYYQFALLSDDGAIFDIEFEEGEKELINNDQLTPTRMKCASKAVYFDKSTIRSFRMKYFQGPRMHIALSLMWRKVDPDNIPNEKYCGKGGNGFFFDFNKVPSEPKRAYLDLLDRGWKPLDSQNFLLPAGIVENPCGEDQKEPEMKCFSEQVVLDGRNWFYFNGDNVNMSTVKIENENGSERRYHYVDRYQKIRLAGNCLRGQKLRISYCVEK